MLITRFAAALNRSALTRRGLWRAWYELLAWAYPQPSWTFMNYGYLMTPPLGLPPEEEADRFAIQLYETVAEDVGLAGREVVEIGSGRGGGAAYLTSRHEPRRLVGVERSHRVVAFCGRRFVRPGLSFQVGDAEALPFEAQSFDVVLNVESSHCYGDLATFFAEVRRVLRPDGHFLYADFRPRSEVAAWRNAVEGAGFVVERERDLSSGVFAALEADDDRKRLLIKETVGRPLGAVFREFAGLRGSTLYEELRAGALSYLAFTLRPAAA